LAGRPVIAHVLERLAPQVGVLAISANGAPERFAPFGCPVLPDRGDDRPGPLAGLLAGLAFAEARGISWLVTVPCDAPFLPRDLVAQLAAAAPLEAPVHAISAQGPEPLFALWPVAARALIEARLAAGQRTVQGALAALGSRPVAIAQGAEPPWNLNLNAPQDLQQAAGLMPP
jgi:molybdopterin-guanine dinucleotide biosynthesis protein A